MEGPEEEEAFGGEVNTKLATRRVWLVKIPTFLKEAWTTAAPSQDLGVVKIKEETGQSKAPEMSLILKADETKKIPTEYKLRLAPTQQMQHIFSETTDGNIAVEGNVEYKLDVQPIYTTQYKEVLKQRDTKANTRTRVVKRIEENLAPRPSTDINFAKKRKVEDKRERIPEDELENLIFQHFEKATYYDLRTLQQITNQPMQYLKGVLDKICIYNKKGPHKGMWEVQPAYKHRTK